jgi:Tfp pilus assembly protein PilO
MARIDPTGRKSAKTAMTLAVVGVLGLAIVYWQFVYSPLKEEVQKKRSTHRKLEKENRDLKEEAKIQSAMLECQPELDALNRQNELMLPEQGETVALMKVLTNMASTAGLAQGPTKKLPEAQVAAPAPPVTAKPKKAEKDKDKKKGKGKDKEKEDDAKAKELAESKDLPCWERVPGLKAAEAASKATFVRVPFEIEVRGTFHQLTRYFWMIHEHAKTGRIITVENLTLESPKATADGIMVTARFVAVGFREADRAAEGGEGGAGAAGAKGGKAVVRDAAASQDAKASAAAEGTTASGTPPPTAAGAPPANPAASGAARLTNPEATP